MITAILCSVSLLPHFVIGVSAVVAQSLLCLLTQKTQPQTTAKQASQLQTTNNHEKAEYIIYAPLIAKSGLICVI